MEQLKYKSNFELSWYKKRAFFPPYLFHVGFDQWWKGMEGVEDTPLQNMPLWHKDHFELQAIRKQWTRENCLLSSFLPKSRAHIFLFVKVSPVYQEQESNSIPRDRVSTQISLYTLTLLK